ncbi:MAG: CCA tRNA nucleotidyltransferase [Alphaproteobacteria bacterium]|nr:CCA tRNA nucleotidyltransferase [Alphaproteobacteria bacterium]
MSEISLRGAAWLSAPGLQHVLSLLDARQGCTRIVGGAVRDALSGRPVTDIDLATSLLPHDVIERSVFCGLKVISTGLSHGIVTLLHEGRTYEVATLRRDVTTDGRHARVVFTKDWLEDARRRDFTINALYVDIHGDIFDPLGGYEDIISGYVRFIGDAAERICEDYLRILRFFRFSAKYGRGALDRSGLQACIEARHGIQRLSANRVGRELLYLLRVPVPESVLLKISETDILQGILCGVVHSVLLRAYFSIERMYKFEIDPFRRLLVLSCAIAGDAQRVGKRLALSRAESIRLAAGSEGYERLSALMDDSCWMKIFYRCGIETYRDLVVMAWVRGVEKESSHWYRIFCLPETWQIPVFPWSGADLVACGILPGPYIGHLLSRLEAMWIQEGFPDNAEHLQRIFLKTSGKMKRISEGDN